MTAPAHPREHMTLRQRIVRAAAAVSYAYLLLTGLAFWTPALYWVAILLGGGFLSRMIHPWVGLFFALLVGQQLAAWHGEMRTTDASRATRTLVRHIREDDDEPGSRGVSRGRGWLFRAMAWSTLMLLLSGLVLWFPHLIPPPRAALRESAALVHAIAALTTAAVVVARVLDALVGAGRGAARDASR